MLPGLEDRETAARWTGRDIRIELTQLPQTDSDEYYWHQLIGLEAFDPQDRRIGRVTELLETGAQDVLVIERKEGEALLVPFHSQFVPAVDLSAGRLTVDWPEA